MVDRESLLSDLLSDLGLIEELADLEHRFWLRWVEPIFENGGKVEKEQLERWSEALRDYDKLTEAQKQAPRRRAMRILEIISEYEQTRQEK